MSGTQSELSILETTLSTLGAKLATYGLGFVASIMISRALGPTGRGLYYMPVALATMAFTLGNLGIESANVHLYSGRRYRLSQLVGNALLLSLCLGAAMVLIGGLAYVALRSSALAGVPAANAAVMLLTVPLSMGCLYLSGLLVLGRRINKVNVALPVAACVQLAIVLGAYVTGLISVWVVLLANAASVAITWLLLLRSAFRALGVDASERTALARDSLSYGLRIHLGTVLSFFNLRLDVFLLSSMEGVGAVGIYSLSVMLAELVWLLSNPLALAVMPAQAESDADHAADLTFRAVRATWLMGLVASALLLLVAWPLVPVLYGQAFGASFWPLAVLAPGVVAMGAQRPLSQYVLRLSSPGRVSAIAGATVVVNVVFNLVLIPRFGPVGAAAASLVSYTFCFWVFALWVSRVSGARISSAWVFTSEDLASYRRFLSPSTIVRTVRGLFGREVR